MRSNFEWKWTNLGLKHLRILLVGGATKAQPKPNFWDSTEKYIKAMTTLIPNLAIAGYRSFGKKIQRFQRFSKINIIIGQNNAGKSNVLRFIHEVYSKINETNIRRAGITLAPLDQHLPDRPVTLVGIGERVDRTNPDRPRLPADHRLLAAFQNEPEHGTISSILGRLFEEKCVIDGQDLCWSMQSLTDNNDYADSWLNAIKKLEDHDLCRVWQKLTRQSGGSRSGIWESEVARRAPAPMAKVQTQLIPAIRQIGQKGTTSDGFDGLGIIERLAKLQNPDALSQSNRKRFNAIRDFLRDILDHPEATIEIPYERDTILVHMDGKVLPIESLGSGIHEVIILASAATVLEDHVVCIEEPELHLNPLLQKKLLRYLELNTKNQYFITTHSAALMDTPNAEIYHIRLSEGASVVERATTDHHRSQVCEDLGYHPSDLLQANCIIWVEGPSDRIYLNWWINSVDSFLIEGIHYSIMFYGGRLASHLSAESSEQNICDFISLRRLNRRGVIVMDSDRDGPHSRVNDTKRRLQAEFDSGPGHAWITAGREIENYLTPDQLQSAMSVVQPKAIWSGAAGRFESALNLHSSTGRKVTPLKVDIARHISGKFSPEFDTLDIRKRILSLVDFIRESNPKTAFT